MSYEMISKDSVIVYDTDHVNDVRADVIKERIVTIDNPVTVRRITSDGFVDIGTMSVKGDSVLYTDKTGMLSRVNPADGSLTPL